MEKYLQAVLEQIRCKKVHPYIREELMGHIQTGYILKQFGGADING